MQKIDKRKLWQEIQTKSPDLAAFIIQVKEVFGKLEDVEVEFLTDKGRGDFK